jgi:hypothetical protein
LLARLHEELSRTAATVFEKRLKVDEFFVFPSDKQVLLHLADLFAGSLNRIINNPGSGARDEFARFFLATVGMPSGPSASETAGDMSVRLQV